MNTRTPLLEACVETTQQAILAEKHGAHRVELCSNLAVGGLTPEDDLMAETLKAIRIPIMAMVRPRGGNFVYNDTEIEVMKTTIDSFKALKLHGVVFGFLTKNQEVDIELTREMVAYAAPLAVTFHKAIDLTSDPVASAQKLSDINGIQRILTSGGKETAASGVDTLKKMREVVGNKTTILVAGKVTRENIEELHLELQATEYHGRRIVF